MKVPVEAKGVVVVLVNFQNSPQTILCLESLMQFSYGVFKILVVDNASKDNSCEELSLWIENHYNQPFFSKSPLVQQHIELIQSSENRGFGAGCNAGIEFALKHYVDSWSHIWLLNNDTTINADTLAEMLKASVDYNWDLVGSQLLRMPEKGLQGYGGRINKRFGTTSYILKQEDLVNLDYLIGASLLLSRACLEKTGLLSEDYFLYYEETEYCFRARQMGFKMGCAVKSIVYHWEGSTTGSSASVGLVPFFTDCIIVRNRIQFANRMLGHSFFSYVGLIISLVNRLKRRQLKRIFCILKICFSKKAFQKFVETKGGSLSQRKMPSFESRL